MLMPVSAKCSWNERRSSLVVVSGERLRNPSLAAVDVAAVHRVSEITRWHPAKLADPRTTALAWEDAPNVPRLHVSGVDHR
jgi:hypothetical protein